MSDSFASLRLFNSVVAQAPATPGPNPIFMEKYGVVIAPCAAHKSSLISDYVSQAQLDGKALNSSFYKNWVKVQTVSNIDRLTDQFMHYFSTYGLESMGLGSPSHVWLPDSGTEVDESAGKLSVLVIKGVSKEELIEACFKMLGSGVALKEETIKDILYVLTQDCGYVFTGQETIKNREAEVMVYDLTGTFPSSSESVMRFLIYKATEETLVIKNKRLIEMVKASGYVLPSNINCATMASTFNRYKPLWLAFKAADRKANSKIVNNISRLSKTLHVPMKANPLSTITAFGGDIPSLVRACKDATPFQVARALAAVRNYEKNDKSRMYNIRNGKMFVKGAKPSNVGLSSYQLPLALALKNKISEKTFYIPDELDYVLPTSEKLFSGNVPTGSSITAPVGENHLLVGVYWEDGDTRVDLDLGATNLDFKIGWNSSWRSGGNELCYSGDMTSAHNGAVEWMYMSNSIKEKYLLSVNLFSGPLNHPFKIVVGYGSTEDINARRMIDPDKVLLQADCSMRSRQMVLGVIQPGEDGKVKFTLIDRAAQNNRVSVAGSRVDILALDSIVSMAETAPRLRDFVKTAPTPEEADVDLSMASLAKDSILSVFDRA